MIKKRDELKMIIKEKLIKPNHIPNDFESFQFCKMFRTEKFLNDFVNGNLYMSTYESISSYDSENLTNGQFDRNEGVQELLKSTDSSCLALDIKENMILQFDGEPTDKSNLTPVDDVSLGSGKYKYNNLLSLYTIWFDFENEKIQEMNNSLIKEFGAYCVIIHDPLEFLLRIIDSLKTTDYVFNNPPRFNFVKYMSTNNENYIELGPFRKTDDYSIQNEARFKLDIKNNKSNLEYFKLGDLSDILTIVKTEDLVMKSKLSDGNFYIGEKGIRLNYNSDKN